MSKHKELLVRVYITVLVVILVALTLAFRVVKINVIEGDKWRERGDSLYVKHFPVEAERGDIIGRNGELLATSLPLFEIRMDTRANGLSEEVFKKGVDSLAYFLSRHANTEWSQSRYRKYLIKQRSKGARYVLIKREANYAELERFKSFPIFRRGQNRGGFIAIRNNQRLRPYGDMASRTIGYARETVQPVGLEGYFDKEMRGTDGKRLMQKVKNAWIPVLQDEYVAATRGADVHTTIDIRMQDIVETALMRAAAHNKPEWATAVLIETETGAIRAIANLDRASGGGYYEGYNHAIGSPTEPGSTFKLASVMAMMEDGYADLDSRVDLQNGRTTFYRQRMEDSHWHEYREVDLRQAFEISSNVGIATLADNAYGKTRKGEEFIARLNQFGLNQTTGVRIPGEVAPYIKEAYDVKQNWSATSIPWMSHGYELQITPLQLLSFYNAVANDGTMMKPFLVTGVARNGRIETKYEPEVVIDQIAKPETVRKAQELLYGVMLRGTGKDKQSDYVQIAGKTGTAVLNYFGNGEGSKKYQGSFAGYFPAEQPKYSLIVVVYGPTQHGYYGGSVALPAFKDIAEQVMALDPVEWKQDTTMLSSDYMVAAGFGKDVEVITQELGVAYGSVAKTDWVMWKQGQENEDIEPREITTSKMPDLMGMGLRDAIYLLENAGMKVHYNGVGKVRKQSVKAGENVSKGAQIYLELN